MINIMAEITDDETVMKTTEIPSNGKTNAALTLGIIGAALGALGSGAGIFKNLGGNSSSSSTTTTNTDKLLSITEEYYKNRISDILQTSSAFAGVKDREFTADFNLYKYSRDSYDALKQSQIDDSFNLYKYTRDANDTILAKVAEVDKKVDIMAAVRPYQDALIDAKINTNAILADYNLSKRTCRMMEGQLVLPSTPVISGYGSYYVSSSNSNSTNSGTTTA